MIAFCKKAYDFLGEKKEVWVIEESFLKENNLKVIMVLLEHQKLVLTFYYNEVT